MSRKWVGLALLLVLVAVAVWLWKRGAHGETTTSPRGSNTPAPIAATVSPGSSRVPAWFVQHDVPSRRVAGKVIANGAPVAGATVRLGFAFDVDLLLPVAVVQTGADGTFDLGAQPAGVFVVSAEDAKHTPVSITISPGDPRAKPDQLVLELGACASRLYGAVVDASGGGIAKARVSVAGLGGTDSDAAGQYSLCLSQTFLRIRVTADGYGSLSGPLRLNGELRYDFVLVPEAIVVGRVVTEQDQPVAGAVVIALPDPSEAPHHVAPGFATADRDGRFRIDGLAPGQFQLTATGDHLASPRPTLAIATPAKSSQEIRLVVAATARVTGHVVMAGQPIAGAGVAVRGQGPRAWSVSAYSQADGSFVLDGVPFGKTAFAASPFDVKSPVSIEIKEALVDVTLEVTKLATLRGHVTRKGKPAATAVVQCNVVPGEIRADRSGAYVVEGLPAGLVRCFSWDPGAKAFTPEIAVNLSAGEDKTLDIELDCAGEVKGIVVDEAGAPVPAAHVRMEIDDGSGDICDSITDAKGNFDCHSLYGGEYIVAVYPSPMSTRAFEPASGQRLDNIKVPKDGVVTNVTLAIKHQRLAISGTVTDDTGAVVTDVHVAAAGRGRRGFDLPSIMSDASGKFEIADLAPGLYSLLAHAADGSETVVPNVAAGSKGVAVKLVRPGSIEGKVVGFAQQPQVQAHKVMNMVKPAIVDGDTFSIVGLTPGRYTVSARGGGDVDGVAVDVRSGEVARVTLKSRGLGRIQGRVTEHGTGAPMANMQCIAKLSLGGQMDAGGSEEAAVTDASGKFAVTSPLGRVRVFCFPQGTPHSVAGTDVEVTTTTVPNVELVSVKNTFGASPGDGGFDFTPLVLPLRVHAVTPNGPAAGVDLKAGDVITSIDGGSLQGVLPMGASFLVQNHKPGSTLALGVDRAGTAHAVKITVAAQPQ